MKRAWTGSEVQPERERLEGAAATTLGFMLFEYSRLDMELGLFLSWVDQGRHLEKMAKKVEALNFNKRLEYLQKAAAERFRESPAIMEAYAGWISDAHEIRELRNRLFHGRWGIEPIRQVVVNVVGLPTSPDQEATKYSLSDLESGLRAISQLRARLRDLRSSFPL
jgi:signal transduction protein with GAF and PtsI domain